MARNYDEMIEKLEPKPKFNLDYYKGEDFYSEGDVEDRIIDMIITNPPEEYVDAVYDNYSWSTFYHLTPIRQNILNWYPFEEGKNVLEIGCGLGAVTSVLCDKCNSVTAVELSKRRAVATLFRCREKDNLEIIVGNLNDIEFEDKYDYITLIGVLEYQGSYTESSNPYKDFLKKIKGLLKPGGKLLIAIENQFGLKYWCGASEDHTTVPFDGLNGYTTTTKKVRTFSRKGLEELVKASGFANTFFYYPMPDYKLPTVIYSDKYLPANANMENVNYYYIPDNKNLIGDESHIFKEVIKNNVFDFFANSFLVECSDDNDLGRISYACISNQRQKEYQLVTAITQEGTVIKQSCVADNALAHLNEIIQNEKALKASGLNVCTGTLSGDKIVYPFVCGEKLDELVLKAYEDKDEDKMYEIFDTLWECIMRSSEQIPAEQNIMYELGIGDISNKDCYGPVLKTAFTDMIFRNAIVKDDDIVWIDQEWVMENTPARFTLYRALVELFQSYTFLEEIMPLGKAFERYGIMECYQDFQKLNSFLFDVVADRKMCAQCGGLPGIDRGIIHNNLVKMI